MHADYQLIISKMYDMKESLEAIKPILEDLRDKLQMKNQHASNELNKAIIIIKQGLNLK